MVMKITLVLLNETVARLNHKWTNPILRMAYASTTHTRLAALVPDELNAGIERKQNSLGIFKVLIFKKQ